MKDIIEYLRQNLKKTIIGIIILIGIITLLFFVLSKKEEPVIYLENSIGEKVEEGTIVLLRPKEQLNNVVDMKLNTRNLKEDVDIHVFVDDRLVLSGNYGNKQYILNLSGENITEGNHIIRIEQYKGNNIANKPIMKQEFDYEIVTTDNMPEAIESD